MSEPNSRPLDAATARYIQRASNPANEARRFEERSAARIVSIAAIFVGFSVRESAMEPTQGEAVARTISRSWVYFLVAQNDGIASLHFSDSLSEVTYEFIERFKLSVGWKVTIEIADQANAKPDIVKVIAVNVSACQLLNPSVANFDLAIAGRRTVTDDEMVGQSVWHFAHVAMIIVKDPSVPLSGSAIMDNDIFPSVPGHACVVDCLADGRSQVVPSAAVFADRGHIGLVTGFLNHDFVVVPLAEEKPAMSFFWLWCGSGGYDWSLLGGRGLRHIRLGSRGRTRCGWTGRFCNLDRSGWAWPCNVGRSSGGFRVLFRLRGAKRFVGRGGRHRRLFGHWCWARNNFHLLATLQKKFS